MNDEYTLPYGLPGAPGGLFGPAAGYEYLGNLLQDISDEAIKADMAHRHFDYQGDGVFRGRGWGGTGATVRWNGSSVEVVVKELGGDGYETDDGDNGLGNAYGVEDRQQELLDELASEVFGFYPGAVADAFEKWFGIADPSGFDGMRGNLSAGASQISAVAGVAGPDSGSDGYDPGAQGDSGLGADLTNLITRTGQMGGKAAKTFAENYVAPLPGVLGNDHLVCTTLGIGLSAQQHVMGYTRENVADLANKAVDAMRQSGPEESSTDGLAVLLTVVGAVAGGVATVASGGTAAPIIAGLVATGAGAASGIIGSTSDVPRKEVELGAGHPRDVLSNIENGLDDLNTEVRGQEEKIRELLDDVLGAARDPGQFDLSRPQLLRVRKANVIVEEDEIFIDKSDIHNITEVWMPNIAGALDGARHGLTASSEPFTRDYAVGLGSTGPWSSYAALEDRLAEILGETARELRRSAEHMQIAAQHIGRADDEADAALDAHSDKLDVLERERRQREAAAATPPPHIMPPGGFDPFS